MLLHESDHPVDVVRHRVRRVQDKIGFSEQRSVNIDFSRIVKNTGSLLRSLAFSLEPVDDFPLGCLEHHEPDRDRRDEMGERIPDHVVMNTLHQKQPTGSELLVQDLTAEAERVALYPILPDLDEDIAVDHAPGDLRPSAYRVAEADDRRVAESIGDRRCQSGLSCSGMTHDRDNGFRPNGEARWGQRRARDFDLWRHDIQRHGISVPAQGLTQQQEVCRARRSAATGLAELPVSPATADGVVRATSRQSGVG